MGTEKPIPILINTSSPSILLRQLMSEDAEALFKLIDEDRSHLSQLGDNTASKYPTLESVLLSITDNPNPDKFRFGIWSDGILVGSANLTPEHPLFGGSGELGYWVGSTYTGSGIASIVAKALVDYAGKTLHWFLLVGRVQKENAASKRVLYRAGFRILCEKDEILHLRTRLSK